MEQYNGKMQSSCNLPEEIITDILTRLPSKSVGRCRCVSKSWRALLSQPDFIKTHLEWRRNTWQESIVLISESERFLFSAPLSDAHHLLDEITISATRLSFADHLDSPEVLASCDGLVLVEDYKCSKFVLNPVTREIGELPASPLFLDPDQGSFTMSGLGYDSGSDDYKIVTVSFYDLDNGFGDDCRELFVNVYSLKSGSWKRAGSHAYDIVCSHIESGVLVNGYLHWLAFSRPKYSYVIVAFDLEGEKLREVPPPSSVQEDDLLHYNLAVLDGCLCLFRNHESIWLMKEYDIAESWTKFTVQELVAHETRPLCMLGPEKLVLLSDEEYLVMYNIKAEKLVDVVVHGTTEPLLAQVSFVESLISPHARAAS